MKSFPQAAAREAAGALIVRLKERYGNSMEINIHDPRCCLWFFDLVKFGIRAEPTWILDGRLLCRGIPEWDELKEKIETEGGGVG